MSNDADMVSKGTSLGGCTVQDTLAQRDGVTRYKGAFESGEHQGKPCCITVYDASCFPSALVRERSLRELRQLMSLDNAALVPVREVGKMDDGGIYEITDLPEGQSLDDFTGSLSPDEAFAVLSAVGDALLAAQNAGVIHRNLGPQAVFFRGDKPGKDLKVAGFGVAEPQGDGSFGPLSTLAPEQVAGKVVDQRSMVYNLAALGHRLITGKDLYEGDRATTLKQHLEGEIPKGTHERFVRALQKDARRRPMMLKQFLDELTAKSAPAQEGGAEGAANAGPKPSTRGWTQFMEDDEVEGGSASGGSKPAAAPVSSSAEVKPSTRGWTMFMESSDAEPEPEAAPEAAPAPVVAAENKPKTRGWTMFMDGPEGADNEAKQEAEPDEKPAAKPSPKPAPAAAKAAPAGDKPKTRGWTMFMEEDPVTAATKTPAPAPQSTPEPAAPAAASAPAAAASVGKADTAQGGAPSTRGWTMFMDVPPGSEAPKAPSTTPAAAAPAAKLESSPESSAPVQRPAANGDGVHNAQPSPEPQAPKVKTPEPAPVPSAAPRLSAKPEQKSAVEASNRRVAMGMPKPQESDLPVQEVASGDPAPAKRARTMVMGGNQQEDAATPVQSEAAGTALLDQESPAPTAATSLSKNPIPESPAPVKSGEPSTLRVIAGAGVAGIVLAAIVLLLAFVLS